jgi:hypothetical protein
VCQFLEVEDERNILKSTLHWRGVQKISITLAILVGFLVNSLFHETKIPTVDMKVQVCSKFNNFYFGKKWNLHSPWILGELALRSVGASFKKWGCCTPILPKALGHFPNFQNMFFLPALHFLRKWSTLAGWLQHMPALPRLLLETSNTHNFWSVGPKNTNFFSREAYCEMHLHKKFQKIKKLCELKWHWPKPVCPPYGHSVL